MTNIKLLPSGQELGLTTAGSMMTWRSSYISTGQHNPHIILLVTWATGRFSHITTGKLNFLEILIYYYRSAAQLPGNPQILLQVSSSATRKSSNISTGQLSYQEILKYFYRSAQLPGNPQIFLLISSATGRPSNTSTDQLPFLEVLTYLCRSSWLQRLGTLTF
jgi:hypothetical protein